MNRLLILIILIYILIVSSSCYHENNKNKSLVYNVVNNNCDFAIICDDRIRIELSLAHPIDATYELYMSEILMFHDKEKIVLHGEKNNYIASYNGLGYTFLSNKNLKFGHYIIEFILIKNDISIKCSGSFDLITINAARKTLNDFNK